MSEFLSPDSQAKVAELSAAFTKVDEVERRSQQIDSDYEKLCEADNQDDYKYYEAVQEILVGQQTQAVTELGQLVIATSRDDLKAELSNSPRLNQIVAAPSRTQSMIRSIDDQSKSVSDILGGVSEPEREIITESTRAASGRLLNQLETQSESAEEALSSIESTQTLLERPLPESTIAGETTDVLKTVMRTKPADQSTKAELRRAKTESGDISKRFLAILEENAGKLLSTGDIAELLHPKDFKLDRTLPVKRVNTMMTRLFAGETPALITKLAKRGFNIQRLAHRTYAEINDDYQLRSVNYEFRVYGNTVEPVQHKTYTTMSPNGQTVEHTWEDPIDPKSKDK